MTSNVSSTIEFVSQCIGCMSENIAGVKSNSELAKIYEDLIQEEITQKLNNDSYIFCSVCEKYLQDFNQFKEVCKESWKKIAEKLTDDWACELEQLLADSPVNGSNFRNLSIDEIFNRGSPIQDDIISVDSDSDASTIPPNESFSEKFNQNIDMNDKADEIVFVDVIGIPNELTDSIDSILYDKNGIDFVDPSSAHQSSINKRAKSNLVHLGLLPKSTDSSKSICRVCHISSDDINGHYITAHTTVEDDTFICSGCPSVHKTQERALKHIKEYHTLYLKPRKCKYCELSFIESGDYGRHVSGHIENTKKHVCNICGKIERHKASLTSHIMRIHNGSLYCKYCYKAFTDQNHYETHMKMEEEKRNVRGDFVCDICGYKSKYKQQIKLHVQSLHKIQRSRDLPCQVCGKRFSSSDSLRHHIKFVHQKRFKCSDCDQIFGFLKDLRYHFERNHTENGLREPCDICGKVLTKKALPLHKNTIHSNVKPFACNVCDRKFKQKILLQKHMYKHSGFRPYFCTVCSKGFYDSPVLQKHFLREHGIKVTHDDIKRDCKRKPNGQVEF